MVKKHLFIRKDTALTSVCLMKYLLPLPLKVQVTDVLEKPMFFNAFLCAGLNTKLVKLESTFRTFYVGGL